MPFISKVWKNKNQGPPYTYVTAEELNRIEQGIADAAQSGGGASDTQVAALVSDPASETKTTLDGSYVAQTAFGAELVRTANAVALRPWRAALANRDNAPARLLLVGDSRTEGEGATIVAKRWQNRLAAALRARFTVEGGNPAYAPINYVPVKYVSPTLAGQSGWSTPSAGHVTPNTFGLGARNVTLGPGHSTTLTFTGTSCKLAYRRPSFAIAFNYSIDGEAAVSVSIPAGTEADGQTVDIGPLATGVHTIVVTGVTNQLSLEGAYIYNGEEAKGIQVFNSAKHGVRSSNAFGSSLPLFKQCVAKADPHCIYVGLGTNDHGANVVPSDFNTNMRALITAMKEACTLSPTIILAIDPGRPSGFTYPWSDYVTVLRGIAADDPVSIALLDLTLRLPDLGDNTLSLYADSLHENNKGQAFRSDSLAGFLSPT